MLRFQVKSRKASIGKKKGQILFFAHKQATRRMTLEQVEESISRSTTLTRGDVRAAIASLTDVVNEAILRGDSVDLGDLGTLRVAVGVKQMDKEEDVNASTLRKPQGAILLRKLCDYWRRQSQYQYLIRRLRGLT